MAPLRHYGAPLGSTVLDHPTCTEPQKCAASLWLWIRQTLIDKPCLPDEEAPGVLQCQAQLQEGAGLPLQLSQAAGDFKFSCHHDG